MTLNAAAQLVNELRGRDIHLELKNEKLVIKGKKEVLESSQIERVRELKAEIIEFLTARAKTGLPTIPALPRTGEQDTFVLSSSQHRLWFIDQLAPGSSQYNLPLIFRVKGSLDLARVETVFREIIQRHQVLRSTYAENENGGVQVVHALSSLPFELVRHDVRGLYPHDDASVQELVTKEASRPFDLQRDLMIRISFFELENSLGILLVNMHHIASDGWSMGVLFREFFTLYQAYAQDRPSPLTPLQVQYADYACWQQRQTRSEEMRKQMAYWLAKLEDVPSVHGLSLDFPRPPVKKYEGGEIGGQLSAEHARALMELAKRHHLTPFMLLHGVLALLFSRHANHFDVVMGMPVANRPHAELRSLIGFFVNTLVLRVDTNKETLAEYFKHVGQVHREAQAHQDVPFDRIVEELNVTRTNAYTPLFQIMLSTQSDFDAAGSDAAFDLPGVQFESIGSSDILAKFDLEINLTLSREGGRFHWTYDKAIFTESRIAQLNRHLESLLSHVARLPVAADVPMRELPVLSPAEVQHLVKGLNPTGRPYSMAATIPALFEQQAANNPEAVALVIDDQCLTYEELNRKANRLSHLLIERFDITPDTLVGIVMNRSLDMVVGILAILKAGGAYLPLDPADPAARLEYMLDDARPKGVLTHPDCAHKLASFNGFVLQLTAGLVDEIETGFPALNPRARADAVRASHLAYVIYTSGSTGKPKGVMVPHLGVVRLVSAPNFMKLGPQTVFLQCANMAFDAATLELWGPLLNGGRCVLYPHARLSPHELNNEIVRHQVNALWLTSGFFTLWSHECREAVSLQWILAGGDVLNMDAVRRVNHDLPGAQLVNGYGPTENTTFTTCYPIPKDFCGDSVPIGRPLQGTACFVLDAQERLLPCGAIGELYAGGDGLGRGYLNRPELTEQKFVHNPFYDAAEPESSSRLYRTGDLVRYGIDGNLEFIGRVDNQVKIRGFRIELGEIETTISANESIDSALLSVRSVSGEQQLIAYVKPRRSVSLSERTAFAAVLKRDLALALPNYMVPSAVLVVDEWPLTANGKIDRRALPVMEAQQSTEDVVPPSSQIESALVAIWSGLLGLHRDKISVDANFFDLGGNSLLTIRMISAMRAQLDREITVQGVFDGPTIREIAALSVAARSPVGVRPLVPKRRDSNLALPSFAQQRLWYIDRLQNGSPEYNIVMSWQVAGELDLALIERTMSTIIARHEVLRTVFVEQDGQCLQLIRDPCDVEFKVAQEDCSAFLPAGFDERVASRAAEHIGKAFDLRHDLMVAVNYLKLRRNEGILIFNIHHIAADGWSMELLFNEFFSLYQSYCSGAEARLAPLALQYADYAEWQRSNFDSAVSNDHKEYWRNQLKDLPTVHGLALDKERPALKRFDGKVVRSELSADIACRLRTLAQQHQLTPFMLLHGALALVLSKHSNSNDIVVGTPVANRLDAGLSSLIGLFVNTLVLRVNTEQDSLAGYFEHLRRVHLEAMAHQDVPFECLVEMLQVARTTAHTPLFQIMLTTETAFGLGSDEAPSARELGGARFAPIHSEHLPAKFDVEVNLALDDSGGRLQWIYDTALFDDGHIAQLNEHLVNLLKQLAQPTLALDSPAMDIDILSPAERRFLLEELNGAVVNYSRRDGIHTIVERLAAEDGSRVAIQYEDRDFSYTFVNERSNQLANYLREGRQVKPGQLIGLCLERSPELIIGMLGILKAGCAYVPIDPAYPTERIAYMVADTRMSLVLCHEKWRPMLDGSVPAIVAIDLLASERPDEVLCGNYSKENGSTSRDHSQDLAYVIYTSGSTGMPKGVMTPHIGVVRLVQSANFVELSADSKILHSANISFDAATFEVWGALLNGGCCVVYPSVPVAPAEINAHISRYRINTIWLTSGLFTQWTYQLPSKDTTLKFVLAGGDILNPEAVKRMIRALPGVSLINGYGPTENTTFTACYTVPQDFDGQCVPIGKGLPGDALYVVDEKLRLVAKGAIGELCVGGDGLALGYLNNEAVTSTRFVDNPFFDRSSSSVPKKLYRTGDLVRLLDDGNLVFVGRNDHQIKIRGFRIELGEIENRLYQSPAVDSALATVAGTSVNKQLIAYVQPKDAAVDPVDFVAAIKKCLGECLPEYMLPSHYVVIDAWPLTPNGKIDRQALPAPEAHNVPGNFRAPDGQTETALTELWSELLRLPAAQISTTAGFFELGGNSLSIVSMQHLIRTRFGRSLELQDIIRSPRIVDIARSLDDGTKKEDANTKVATMQADGTLVVLNRGGAGRLPILMLPPLGGYALCYREMAQIFDPSVPLFALQAAKLNVESIEEIRDYYIELICSVQPEGPLCLVGWSMGGLVAHEISVAMGDIGRHCEVTMIDSGWIENEKFDLTEQEVLSALIVEHGLFEERLLDTIAAYPLEQQLSIILEQGKSSGDIPETFSYEELCHRFEVIRRHYRALALYQPRRSPLPTCFYEADEMRDDQQRKYSENWGAVIPSLRVVPLHGNHHSVIRRPSAETIVEGVMNQYASIAEGEFA
jgi:amino acid adenylation domain-containing protein